VAEDFYRTDVALSETLRPSLKSLASSNQGLAVVDAVTATRNERDGPRFCSVPPRPLCVEGCPRSGAPDGTETTIRSASMISQARSTKRVGVSESDVRVGDVSLEESTCQSALNAIQRTLDDTPVPGPSLFDNSGSPLSPTGSLLSAATCETRDSLVHRRRRGGSLIAIDFAFPIAYPRTLIRIHP
jgi:hypothetical protein